MDELPKLRPIVWLGNSRKTILTFPEKVRKLVGDELQLSQYGVMPKDAKPLRGIGPGVIEIAVKH
ncbi:MAG: addiction module toxin RelE, partial [Coleofasciculus sp. C2-GNP5-27]